MLLTPALAYADLLTATVTSEQQHVIEGSSAVFAVTLTGGTGSQEVTVDFTVSGTAEPETIDDGVNGDYNAPEGDNVTGVCVSDSATCSGTVTFDAGDTTRAITIVAIRDPGGGGDVPEGGDDVLEGGETLTVTLTDISTKAGAVNLGMPNEATTTIIDHGTVTVSVAPATVVEGEEATLTVTLSGPSVCRPRVWLRDGGRHRGRRHGTTRLLSPAWWKSQQARPPV